MVKIDSTIWYLIHKSIELLKNSIARANLITNCTKFIIATI